MASKKTLILWYDNGIEFKKIGKVIHSLKIIHIKSLLIIKLGIVTVIVPFVGQKT